MMVDFIRNCGTTNEVQDQNKKALAQELLFWGIDSDYFSIDVTDIELAQNLLGQYPI